MHTRQKILIHLKAQLAKRSNLCNNIVISIRSIDSRGHVVGRHSESVSIKQFGLIISVAIILTSVIQPIFYSEAVKAAGEGGTVEIMDSTRVRFTNSAFGIDKVVPMSPEGIVNAEVVVARRGESCNLAISMSGLLLAQVGVPVTITATPGSRVESLGGSPLLPCTSLVTSNITGRNVNVTGTDKINAPPADDVTKQIIKATSRIKAPDGDASTVEEGNAPEKDKITITGASVPTPVDKTGDREITNYGRIHEITYKVEFKPSVAGNYRVCSVVADKCVDVVKKPNEILNVVIDADPSKYDITVKDKDEDEDEKDEEDCVFEGKLLEPGSWAPSALDWFGCVVIQGLIGVIEASTEGISAMLETDEGQIEKNELKVAAKPFLTIANILFLIAFLFIIISQAMMGKF